MLTYYRGYMHATLSAWLHVLCSGHVALLILVASVSLFARQPICCMWVKDGLCVWIVPVR